MRLRLFWVGDDRKKAADERGRIVLSAGAGTSIPFVINNISFGMATAMSTYVGAWLDTIEGAAGGVGLSQAFVGFVIIPIIGNAAEHSTAVVMANKGKMDLAFGVALGSSTQIALFVIPVMVLVAWGMDKPLDLFFGQFETAIIFLSSLIVSHIVGDDETNWLEGVMLLFAYSIICFAFFFYSPSSMMEESLSL